MIIGVVTSAASPSPLVAGRRSGATGGPSVWLHGRGVDLLLGYGLGYWIAVPLLLGWGMLASPESHYLWFASAVSLLTATPHYGATLLRVYEERRERVKYAIFSVWITAALVALFLAGLYERWLGSLLLTVYVSWSPWHFSGQNYGLAVMYLRRNGTPPSPAAKRSLYGSFVLCAGLAFVAIHTSGSSLLFAQQAFDQSATFRVLKLGIPVALGAPLAGVLGVLYLGCLVRFAALLRPRPSAASMLPLACLIGVQALWFAVPALATAFGVGNVRLLLPFAAVTISAAHSLQYLWVTSYYAGLARSQVGVGRYFVRCALAGAAIGAPALLFVPGLFGDAVPNAAGAAVVAFSVVNIHHFILDGAIWKLRDGRVARALLRSQPEAEVEGASSAVGRLWLRGAALSLGAVVVLANVTVIWLARQANPEAEPRTLQRTASWLAWFGKDTPELWSAVAEGLEGAGDFDGAIAAWRASLGRGKAPLVSANRLAWLLIEQRADDPESLAEATALASYLAEEMGSEQAKGLQTLAAVHLAAGRHELAVKTAERALEIARAQGNPTRIRQVQNQVRSYRAEARRAASAPGGLPEGRARPQSARSGTVSEVPQSLQ